MTRRAGRNRQADGGSPADASDERTVSDVVVDVLADAGAKRIYGVTGDALNGFVEALRIDGRLDWVGVRHEESAAFAAYAESEITGGLGVCAGSVGPGALHLINGLYNAKREGAAVVAITGQVSRELKGRSYFQEVDLSKVFDDVCGMQVALEDPSQLPVTVELAVRRALSEREVVRIELPVDVTTLKVPGNARSQAIALTKARVEPEERAVAAAASILDGAARVAILAGVGCRAAKAEVLRLAEHLSAPVVHTLKAKDIFDEREGLVVGTTGFLGMPAGYDAVKRCDALLMLGTGFPFEEFYPDDARIVQVDVRADRIGQRASVEAGIVGDVGATAQALVDGTTAKKPGRWLRQHQKLRDRWVSHARARDDADDARPGALDPAVVARAVVRRSSPDAIFTVDTGSCVIWIGRAGDLSGGRRLLGSFNHGSMGAAVPTALGAASAAPGREVWALAGDGGFMMSSHELVTFRQRELPVRVVVFNNSQLAFVKMEMEAAGFPYYPTSIDLPNPDFVALAQASGWESARIESAADVETVLDAATAAPGPFLIDAVVSPEIFSLPPHVKLDHAWGFGMSKLSEAPLFARAGDHAEWDKWKREIDAES
jgi:thiamine pyrophosphate-dependent acetolactate synthase large subunit-like protein